MSQRTVTHQIKLPTSLTIILGLIAFGLIANVLKPVLKIDDAFAADEKVLHAGNPDMKEEWIRFFELLQGHHDEITIILGTNWQSKTFNFSK